MFARATNIGGVTVLFDWLVDHWRLAAIAALFFVGIALRRSGVAGATQGRWLLNFVFHVGLPILIFLPTHLLLRKFFPLTSPERPELGLASAGR